jgi:cytochrome c2
LPLAAYAQGDAVAGERVFAHCAPCHSLASVFVLLGRIIVGAIH